MTNFIRIVSILAALGLLACDPEPSPGGDAGPGPDAGTFDAGPGLDSGPSGEDAGPPDPDAGPIVLPCDPSDPQPPPAGSVLWAMPLAGVGEDTLRAGAHGHNDEKGPVGFCNEAREAGQPYYRLVAAGFESDEDLNSDGDDNDGLGVDFWRDPGSFTGVGESGGRVNIYVDVYDETGTRLNRDNAPELRYLLSAGGGAPMSLPLDAKPPNEFQTNFPMTGGGATFSLEVEGLSDRVHNMRLPINHHVTYLLIFQREI